MKLNDTLQWIGAVFIIIGHVCNSIGPEVYPYNTVGIYNRHNCIYDMDYSGK